jgi:hypothetical protein
VQLSVGRTVGASALVLVTTRSWGFGAEITTFLVRGKCFSEQITKPQLPRLRFIGSVFAGRVPFQSPRFWGGWWCRGRMVSLRG